VLNLSTVRATQADDPSRIGSFYEGNKVQSFRLRSERDHPQLAVLKTVIHPHHRSIPIKFFRLSQGNSMLDHVACIFSPIKLDLHDLL